MQLKSDNALNSFDYWKVVFVSAFFLFLSGLLLYAIIFVRPKSLANRQLYFNEHVAILPEVQEMYNISLLQTDSWIFSDEVVGHLARSVNGSFPRSLGQLTTELLFNTVTKQRNLEADYLIRTDELRSELEVLKDLNHELRNEVRTLSESLRGVNDVVQVVLIVGVIFIVLRCWQRD